MKQRELVFTLLSTSYNSTYLSTRYCIAKRKPMYGTYIHATSNFSCHMSTRVSSSWSLRFIPTHHHHSPLVIIHLSHGGIAEATCSFSELDRALSPIAIHCLHVARLRMRVINFKRWPGFMCTASAISISSSSANESRKGISS